MTVEATSRAQSEATFDTQRRSGGFCRTAACQDSRQRSGFAESAGRSSQSSMGVTAEISAAVGSRTSAAAKARNARLVRSNIVPSPGFYRP